MRGLAGMQGHKLDERETKHIFGNFKETRELMLLNCLHHTNVRLH